MPKQSKHDLKKTSTKWDKLAKMKEELSFDLDIETRLRGVEARGSAAILRVNTFLSDHERRITNLEKKCLTARKR